MTLDIDGHSFVAFRKPFRSNRCDEFPDSFDEAEEYQEELEPLGECPKILFNYLFFSQIFSS